MSANDPLFIGDPLLLQYDYNNINRRGRPRLNQVKKFSPQPKSLIILKLSEEEKSLKSLQGEQCSELSCNVSHDFTDIHSSDDEQTTPDELGTLDQQASHVLSHCESYKEVYGNKSIDKDGNINLLYNRINNKKDHKEYLPKNTKNCVHMCDYDGCGYSTKILTNLTKHKRMHTKEKPYLCDQCIFRSNYVSSLKVHKRIHTSERPFCCEHCGYQCNSSSNLKKHLLHKHG